MTNKISIDRSTLEQVSDLLQALGMDTNYGYGGDFIDWANYTDTNELVNAINTALEQPQQSECFCNQGQVCGVCDPIFQPQGEQEPAATIAYYEGQREPRLLSWNKLPSGEYWMYTHPHQQSSLHLGLIISEGRLHTSLMRREANSHMTVLNTSVVDVDHLTDRDYIITLEAK